MHKKDIPSYAEGTCGISLMQLKLFHESKNRVIKNASLSNDGEMKFFL